MHLKKLAVRNFRRLQDVVIDLASDISIFVGANNSGKTSVGHALQLFTGHGRFDINGFRHGVVASRFVFPMNCKTIGNYFSHACKLLEIDDLHFHDLRHEATTRLFERGYSIIQVQQITLHSSWATLQRYCNLNPGDVDV